MVILYPELQKQLEVCEKCDNYRTCYSHEGSVYHTDIVKKVCRNLKVIEAMEELRKLRNLDMKNMGR